MMKKRDDKIGWQKSQEMGNQTFLNHQTLTRKLDINITRQQVHWIKHRTRFHKKKKKKKKK